MARTGMAYLREDLRGLTEAGTADWTAGTTAYFADDVLDTILDRHQKPFTYAPLDPETPVNSGGTYIWTVYELEGLRNIEQTTGGTAVFVVQNNTGGTVASSDYTVDYRNGLVTFTSNTLGAAYYATGYSYDINAAASDVWRMKANHAAASFDFSTDNHSIKRSQVYQQYMAQADYYQSISDASAGGRGLMEREDTDGTD